MQLGHDSVAMLAEHRVEYVVQMKIIVVIIAFSLMRYVMGQDFRNVLQDNRVIHLVDVFQILCLEFVDRPIDKYIMIRKYHFSEICLLQHLQDCVVHESLLTSNTILA